VRNAGVLALVLALRRGMQLRRLGRALMPCSVSTVFSHSLEPQFQADGALADKTARASYSRPLRKSNGSNTDVECCSNTDYACV